MIEHDQFIVTPRSGVRSSGHHRIAENAEIFNFDFDNVAGLEQDLRVAKNAHALGSSCGDDVTGLESDAFGDELDEFGDAKDHFGGVGVLQSGAVDARADGEGVRIRDFVASSEVGPDRTESVARFSADPLLVGELPGPGGNVVEGHIAEDVVQCIGSTDGFAFAPDNDGEFRLVIDLRVGMWDDDGVVGAADAGGKFGEDDGSGGQSLGTGLEGMVAIIEAHGDDFSGSGDGSAKSNLGKWREGVLRRLRENFLSGIESGLASGKESGSVGEEFGRNSQTGDSGAQVDNAIVRKCADTSYTVVCFKTYHAHGILPE
jgi:hypothetical protein